MLPETYNKNAKPNKDILLIPKFRTTSKLTSDVKLTSVIQCLTQGLVWVDGLSDFS